jgi:apolipoprotein D and lipocalin family protein
VGSFFGISKFHSLCLFSLLFFGFLGCTHVAHQSEDDPRVVLDVDLNRYVGIWYEIGRYPTFFQRDCMQSTAEYKVISATEISVKNTCIRESKSKRSIEGVAKVVTPPAKLKVDFGFFRRGDYWITDLDADYQWAVVSGPKRDSLFILARQAPMAAETLKQILDRLVANGFDTSTIIYDQY